MKAVLMSIHPKWCEKIFRGEKTIEVRKTAPKLETPFTVYVYQTRHKCERGDLSLIVDALDEIFECGKVIGSFVCDRVFELKINGDDCGNYWLEWDDEGDIQDMCLSYEELETYLGKSVGHGWHITEPKLFDKPKELWEFYVSCKKNKQTADENCKGCPYAYDGVTTGELYCDNALTRPPMSWCYVEE